MINEREVSPLLLWMLYVATDLTGLMRLGWVQRLLKICLDSLLNAKEEDEQKDEIKSEVGYDAHVGGAIAGVLWQLPSLFVKRRR